MGGGESKWKARETKKRQLKNTSWKNLGTCVVKRGGEKEGEEKGEQADEERHCTPAIEKAAIWC